MATDDAPERNEAIPAAAIWRPDEEKWELAQTNARGEKDGDCLKFRPDGTAYLRTTYSAGVQDGPFFVYHPNGQIARRGLHIAGEIDGDLDAFASDAPTMEMLRSCCVPDGAWQLRASYARGRLQRQTFYNRNGEPLLSDGRVRPLRPAGLPEAAQFYEGEDRWYVGQTDPNSGQWVGAWRAWTVGGAIDEESEYADGFKIHTRLFDQAGRVRLEAHFSADGVRTGPYRRCFVETGESPYADESIRQEAGAFEREQPVGIWTFCDAAGVVLRSVDWGLPYQTGGGNAEVFSDEDRPAEGWRALAASLRAAGRIREALCAVGRAAALSGHADDLRVCLLDTVVPLSPDEAARRTAALADLTDENLAGTLNLLIAGVDPAAVFRTMASQIKGAPGAARDFAELAVLLAPERTMTYVTRALIRIEIGDADGALADAQHVATDSEETAEFVRTYVRLIFPTFSFWPSGELPSTPLENMPDAPEQSLSAVHHAIQVYATRLMKLRAAVVARLARLDARVSPSAVPPPRPWLPPDVSLLLPEGPVVLRNEAAQIVDETDTGPETTDVQIDESLEPSAWPVPALMRLARANWNGLCWLCWAAGLSQVALPADLSPPTNFKAAAGMAIARYWRALDAVATGGLRALTAGVPGFVWEGLEIAGMPKHFAQMASDEFLEMRSVFLWLASPENISPFQSDLRKA